MDIKLAVLALCSAALPLVACDDGIVVRDPPVVIGVLAPQTGPLAGTGTMMAQVTTLAAAEINAAGGIDGRRLEIRITDIGNETDVGPAFRALVDGGAHAVIGPATQEQVVTAVPAAVASSTVFVSPISTTPWRTDNRPEDQGYMFRVVAADELQTLALAYYLRTLDATTPKKAVVMTESFCDCGPAMPAVCSLAERDFATEPARGVANYFECFYENTTGGQTRTVIDELLFKRNSSDAEIRTTAGQIGSLFDNEPFDVAVLAGLEQDALKIIAEWIRDHPNAGATQRIRWLTTATTKTPGFTANMPSDVFAGLPAASRPIAGSAPTPPVVGRAYRSLERAYRRETGEDVALRAFAPNVWDAVYLLSAAMTKQSIDGANPGGPGLRDAVNAVSSGGPILHAGQWIDLTAILRAGGDVDYDGASGPVDLVAGEVIGPYEIWLVEPQPAGGFAFEREFYIDARTIPDVLTSFGITTGKIEDLIATCSIPAPEECP